MVKFKWTQSSARSNLNVRSMGQNLKSNSPERGQQKRSNAQPLPVHPSPLSVYTLIPALHTMGSSDGAVVRALASHQCVPRATPGPGAICGLSLLLALVLARFFSGSSSFPSNTSKFQIPNSKFQFDLGGVPS